MKYSHASRTLGRYPLTGENCTVISTDVVGFGSHDRNDRDRLIIRAAHLEALYGALGYLGGWCTSEDRGDGLLVVVPPEIPTAAMMRCLLRKLPGRLRRHNRASREPVRIRLRVAVDVGPVTTDRVGWSGEVFIRVARMLETQDFKDAMASTAASIGVIITPFVFDTAIRHAEGWADPARYRPIEVNVKECRMPARMQLIESFSARTALRAWCRGMRRHIYRTRPTSWQDP